MASQIEDLQSPDGLTNPATVESDTTIVRNTVANYDYILQDIYVDVSNVFSSMKNNVDVFLRVIEDGRLVNRRIAFGSKTSSEPSDWERQFKSVGYQTRSELRPTDEYESMVDDCIAAHVYRTTLLSTEKVRIVILSGDGNQKGSTAIGIYDSILIALLHGVPVTVWGWSSTTSNNYKNLAIRFPSLFQLKFLDAIVVNAKLKNIPKPVPYFDKIDRMNLYHLKVMTKDKSNFPKNTHADNWKFFNPLFGKNRCISVSPSPLKPTPHIIFAYFASNEDLEQAMEIARGHPFVTLNGTVYELEFGKCAEPGTRNLISQRDREIQNASYRAFLLDREIKSLQESQQASLGESQTASLEESHLTSLRESQTASLRESTQESLDGNEDESLRESQLTSLDESHFLEESLQEALDEIQKETQDESTSLRESQKASLRESTQASLRESQLTSLRESPSPSLPVSASPFEVNYLRPDSKPFEPLNRFSPTSGVLETPTRPRPRLLRADPENTTIYSIYIRGKDLILPKRESFEMKKIFEMNFKLKISVLFASASKGESTADKVFCSFPSEESANEAIQHFKKTKIIVMNDISYQIHFPSQPQLFQKREKVVERSTIE